MDFDSILLARKLEGGGGGSSVDVESLSVTANGTYQEEGKAYSPVTVNVSGGNIVEQVIDRTISGNISYSGDTTDLLGYCFANTQITSFSSSKIVRNSKGYGFYGCTNLQNVSIPNFKPNGASPESDSFFEGCTSLQSVHLPLLKKTGAKIFYGCTSLSVVVLPSLINVANYYFYGCTNLTKIDLGTGSYSFGSSSLVNCGVTTLILRQNGVAGIWNLGNVANGSPLVNGGVTVYVPSAQISAYQSATNWSTVFATAGNSIQAIEGSIYETQYADGTPIS